MKNILFLVSQTPSVKCPFTIHYKNKNSHHCFLAYANTLLSFYFYFLATLKSLLMKGEKGFIFVQKKNPVSTKMEHKRTHSFVYILKFSSLYRMDSLTLVY